MLKFSHDLIAIAFLGSARDREDEIASTLQACASQKIVAMVACQITGDAKAA